MRIAVVNDSPLAREALRRVVVSSPECSVAWLAEDGARAIEEARRDTPDLILMDLFMPGIDGAEATRRIMSENPCPIVVVTASVSGHFGKVYEAMGHGALDAIDTPTLSLKGSLDGAERLLSKIATVAKLTRKVTPRFENLPSQLPSARARATQDDTLVAIGASTGGPNAFAEVLGAFPKGFHATVVLVQHIDAAFMPGLARWLGEKTGHLVEIAVEGEKPRPGRFYLAGTNDHLVIDRGPCFRYSVEPREFVFRPSVDAFFESAALHWPTTGVGVLLTGMQRDGAAGLLSLRRGGWLTIAQDEASSVIWGMPRAAVEIGAASSVLPLSQIGKSVVDFVRQRPRSDEP